MSTLHVLAPRLVDSVDAQAFARWLARADRLPVIADARVATLRALFRFTGEGLPVAALRHHACADDAASGAWVCADPAYVRSEATGARLMAWPLSDLEHDDAEALAATLKPLFGDAGMPLTVDAPSAWCLHLPGGTPRASFMSPDLALGAGLLECLPEGNDGRAWRRLFNEAQVALHTHPVNVARNGAGKLPVNALWFWGAGALPTALDSGLGLVASDDAMLRGFAKLAGVACVAPVPLAFDASVGGDALLDLDAAVSEEFATTWLPLFRDWLRNGRFAGIEFTFPGGERFHARHAHRLRFWRRG